METSLPIQAGGEIFVSYGPDYWRGAHSSSHSTSLVPVWEWDLSDPFAQLLVARVLSPGPLIGSVHADLCPGSVPAGGFGWDFVEPHSVNSSDPPLLGRSFSLSVPSRRVGEFLGSLLRVALGLPLPPITVTSECTVSAVSFSPLADRSRRNVAFWRSSLATLAVPVVRRPVSRVRPLRHSVRPRSAVPSGVPPVHRGGPFSSSSRCGGLWCGSASSSSQVVAFCVRQCQSPKSKQICGFYHIH